MARILLNIFVALVYIIIFKIKGWRSLGCFIIVESVSIGGIGLYIRFIYTSLNGLEVFFIVFLGALALLLFVMVLTKIENNIGFKLL